MDMGMEMDLLFEAVRGFAVCASLHVEACWSRRSLLSVARYRGGLRSVGLSPLSKTALEIPIDPECISPVVLNYQKVITTYNLCNTSRMPALPA